MLCHLGHLEECPDSSFSVTWTPQMGRREGMGGLCQNQIHLVNKVEKFKSEGGGVLSGSLWIDGKYAMKNPKQRTAVITPT